MSLQDIKAAAETEVLMAEDVLAHAKAKFQAAIDAIDAAAPHLSLWAEVEAAAQKYGAEASQEFQSLAQRARALF
jgi:hypothetical protein